jgi:DNA-binding transcriptional regulator GbsR (MarR family)
MSLDDMASYLDVSKAAVSTNIRLLERWKVVRRVYNRGDRKNYYEIRGDLWEIETEIISTIVKDELEKFATLLGRVRPKLEDVTGDEKADVDFVAGRLDELDDYLDAVQHLMNVLLKPGRVTSANIKKITIA